MVCGLFHFSYLCVLKDFIGRMIGIEVLCLLLCKLNNQKRATPTNQVVQIGQQKEKQSEKEQKSEKQQN